MIELTATLGEGTTQLTADLTTATGNDKHYLYICATPSSRWEIHHNLGKLPSVTIVDSAGSEVEGEVEHLSQNELVVIFSGSFSGTAALN